MGKRKQVVFNKDDIKSLQKNEAEIDENATVIELYESTSSPLNVQKDDEQNIIEIRTSQCAPLKTVIETLYGLIPNANFCFTKEKIVLRSMNIHNTLFINMELEADNFEKYICQVDKFSIGVKLSNFYKIINSIGSNNVLTIFINKNDPNNLGINAVVDDKNTNHTWSMNLLDTKSIVTQTPDINKYPVAISVSSNYFQKICRDAGRYTTEFEISRDFHNRIILTFRSDNMSQETTIGTGKDNLIFLKNEQKEEIIQGKYHLKDLNTFSKCTSISDRAFIYMSNEYPLMIQYSVGNLGKIQLFMSQIITNKNINS